MSSAAILLSSLTSGFDFLFDSLEAEVSRHRTSLTFFMPRPICSGNIAISMASARQSVRPSVHLSVCP